MLSYWVKSWRQDGIYNRKNGIGNEKKGRKFDRFMCNSCKGASWRSRWLDLAKG